MPFTQPKIVSTDYQEAIKLLTKSDVIFSGSFVLKLYGLLPEDREVHDIDLVFKTKEELVQFISNTSGKLLSVESDSATEDDLLFNIEIPDILGIKIDCFINPNVPVAERKFLESIIKTQMPKDILYKKLNILIDRSGSKDDVYMKHLNDFNYIFGGK